MAYQTIKAMPVAGALGAMIEGVDLSQELDNAQASDLHQALLDHCVIFFRAWRRNGISHWAAAWAPSTSTNSSRRCRAIPRSSSAPNTRATRRISAAAGTPM